MNNEPVAWMMKAREPSLHCPDYVTFEKPTRDMKISHHPYPLYTHPADESFDRTASHMVGEYVSYPAKTLTEDTECQYCKQGCIRCDARKTLTDEELLNQWHLKDGMDIEDEDLIRFARAILRKANEK